jgi:ABC-type lipoprotein export system ATPase subunit
VTGDLDSESGMAIMRLLAKLNEEGMTIVYVTHDPRMAEFAQRLINIYDGKLLNSDGSNSLGGTMDTSESLLPNPDTS